MSGFENNKFNDNADQNRRLPQDATRSEPESSGSNTIDGQNTQYPAPEPSSTNLDTNDNQNQRDAHTPTRDAQSEFSRINRMLLAQQAPQRNQTYGRGAPQGTAAFPARPRQQVVVTALPGSNGASGTNMPPKYASMPTGWEPDRHSTERIVDRRETVPLMTEEGRRHVRQAPPHTRNKPHQIKTRDNFGLNSGMFWFGFFDPNRPNTPVTKCSLQILRGRGSEGRGASHAWPNQRDSRVIIPAGLSLSEICRDYPNHVWGEMLRLFISDGWDATRIYANFPEDVRKECQKDAEKKKSHSGRPHNFLQAAMGREVDAMSNEDGIYRKIIPNPRKGHKRTRPAPGDSDRPASGDDQDDGDGFGDGRDNSLKHHRSGSPRSGQETGQPPFGGQLRQSGSSSSFTGASHMPGPGAARGRSSQSLSPHRQMQSPRVMHTYMSQPAPGNRMHQMPSPSRRSIPNVQPGTTSHASVNHAGRGQINRPTQSPYQQEFGAQFPGLATAQNPQSRGFSALHHATAFRGQQNAGGFAPFNAHGPLSIGDIVASQHDEQMYRQQANAALLTMGYNPQQVQPSVMIPSQIPGQDVRILHGSAGPNTARGQDFGMGPNDYADEGNDYLPPTVFEIAQNQVSTSGMRQVRDPEPVTPAEPAKNEDQKHFYEPFGP